jgi:hypothetical protein
LHRNERWIWSRITTTENEKKGFKKYVPTFLDINVLLKIYKKHYKGIYWQCSASEHSLNGYLGIFIFYSTKRLFKVNFYIFYMILMRLCVHINCPKNIFHPNTNNNQVIIKRQKALFKTRWLPQVAHQVIRHQIWRLIWLRESVTFPRNKTVWNMLPITQRLPACFTSSPQFETMRNRNNLINFWFAKLRNSEFILSRNSAL